MAATAAVRRGALLVLEGADRAGKSSQASFLLTSLQATGISAKLWRFPARETTIGKMIDAYLKSNLELSDEAIHLLFSANRWELKSALEQELSQGTTIILDRYAFSGVAFTAAKGLSMEWCKAPDAGLIAPDLTIFLDVPTEVAASRGNFGEERYETTDFQKRVQKQFAELRTKDWKIIDASQSREAVAEEIYKLATDAIHANQYTPLKFLW